MYCSPPAIEMLAGGVVLLAWPPAPRVRSRTVVIGSAS